MKRLIKNIAKIKLKKRFKLFFDKSSQHKQSQQPHTKQSHAKHPQHKPVRNTYAFMRDSETFFSIYVLNP